MAASHTRSWRVSLRAPARQRPGLATRTRRPSSRGRFQAELRPLLLAERFVRAATGLVIILGLLGTFYGLTLSIGKLVHLVAVTAAAHRRHASGHHGPDAGAGGHGGRVLQLPRRHRVRRRAHGARRPLQPHRSARRADDPDRDLPRSPPVRAPARRGGNARAPVGRRRRSSEPRRLRRRRWRASRASWRASSRRCERSRRAPATSPSSMPTSKTTSSE